MKIKIMNDRPLRVIIIGSTSGIGEQLALDYARSGNIVGVTGRRLDKLKETQQKYFGKIFIKQIDVTKPVQAVIQLDYLIDKLGGLDILIYSSGIGHINRKLEWDKELQTIETNVIGFTAIADKTLNYFINQKNGQLVNISSINALRGSNLAPAYAASKAYSSNYMEGLRKKVKKTELPIFLTDIKPGFVDTDMAKGDGLFWVSSTEKASKQIRRAIDKKRKSAYISRRWRLIGWLLKMAPDWLYFRI